MNEDFSETINRFKDVLASKDIDLSKLSEAFKSKKSEDSSSDFDFDIETIIKLKNILSSAKSQSSPRIKLMEDLKPFLKQDTRQKLDDLIKLAKVLIVLEALNKNTNRKFI